MAGKRAWYLNILLQLISSQSPPPPAPTTPPRRWARPGNANGGKAATLPAMKQAAGKKNISPATDTPARKFASLSDHQPLDRWTKVKEGTLSGKHTKVEL